MDLDKKNSFLDSLLLITTKLNNDSNSRKFLFDLSTEFYYSNQFNKSLKTSKRVLQLSIVSKDTLGIAKSLYYIGDSYESTHKDSSYFYYHQAEKFYRLLSNDEMAARMLFNKAYVMFYYGNYLESEIMVSQSLKLLKKSDDKRLIFTCYNLLGSALKNMEEYNSALLYYLNAQQLLNNYNKIINENDTKNNFRLILSVNIADVYERQFEYSKAEKELESVLTKDLKEKWPKDYATVIGNLGYVKSKLGQSTEGEVLMKEALFLSRKSGIESSIVYKLHNLGKYYVNTKDARLVHYSKIIMK